MDTSCDPASCGTVWLKIDQLKDLLLCNPMYVYVHINVYVYIYTYVYIYMFIVIFDII